MLPRVLSLDERIRKSELFPRIRDAEASMLKNEEEFQKKRRLQKKQQQMKHKLDLKAAALADSHQSPVKQENHYFTGFVLNKDPSCSQYMPFDEVFFPKLFNKVTKRAPPETINSLWMLGFEDHVYRERQPKVVHHEESTQMDVSTVASSSQKPDGAKKKKKHHKFEAIYGSKPI